MFRAEHEQPSLVQSGTHSRYSSLFSSVTLILDPPGFKSWEMIFPSNSMSTEKNISRPHSSMSLSLCTKRKEKGEREKKILYIEWWQFYSNSLELQLAWPVCRYNAEVKKERTRPTLVTWEGWTRGYSGECRGENQRFPTAPPRYSHSSNVKLALSKKGWSKSKKWIEIWLEGGINWVDKQGIT